MSVVYTHGTWTVKPRRADDFVDGWQELAEWTRSVYPDARGTLVRDRDDPNVFLSFGPWPDAVTAAAWRSHPEFQAHVGRIRESLESFEPRLLDLVVEVG